MFFNAANMSADEHRFIRLYVRVLQYRYDALQAVMAHMHPDNLALTSVLHATDLEHKMAVLHADFETALHRVSEKDRMSEKRLPRPSPSAEELADIVMLSFFKVVGVMNNDSKVVIPNNAYGWFSGKPKEWEKLLQKLLDNTKGPDPALPDALLGQCLNAISKLFPGYGKSGLKNWTKLYPPNYKQKFYEDDPYFDDEYYEDDEDLDDYLPGTD